MRTASIVSVIAATLCGLIACLPADRLTRHGVPAGPIVCRGQFAFSPDDQHRSARWVLERLTPESLTGHANRDGMRFVVDADALPEVHATASDYRASGFDQGHLAPAANYTRTADMRATFNYGNCTPEVPEMNRGVMAKLEAHCRDIARTGDETWIVTAPVYTPPPGQRTLTITYVGANVVAVPPFVAKSLLVRRGTDYECHSWIVPNVAGTQSLDSLRVTTDTVEFRCGLGLWGKLDKATQDRIEAVR